MSAPGYQAGDGRLTWSEITCLKHDITGSFFVEQIKQKAAMKCVEIAEAMHVDEYGNGQCGEIAELIKAHFKLQEAQK